MRVFNFILIHNVARLGGVELLHVVVLNFWCPLFETTVINMIRDFSHIGEHAFTTNHAQISFVMILFLHMDADVLANMASVVLSPV